ncbi:SRPBCC family protein [Conexibacter sp. SYSU D00693]|uniref:SRPBCC family protein n=1 Tax=Conexibacter sp. SYSU D00693 TaxID=2812560 RepID=UPI00196AF1BA|nr:SRPBCC family protein [Conexibacter sp. SYSU D00693]
MAVTRKWVPAPVEDCWAIVADARSYAFWVVGSHDVRAAEGEWPAAGSTFHHTQGHGPVKLKDTTTVRECEPPHRLVLEVRVRPFGIGRVALCFEPDGEGTCMTIDETFESGPLSYVPRPLMAPAIAFRNEDGLRRLAAMAWTRAATLDRAPDEVGGGQAGSAAAGTTPRSSARRTKARA